MMKKTITVFLMALLLLMTATAGVCETLYVDNRETDKVYPERLNLRAEPSKNGAILGLYYTGAEVESLGNENEEYTHVQIGGMTGYMASEYLITYDEALRRYGEDSGFGQCRAAEVDLNGLWMTEIPLLAQTDPQGEQLGALVSGERVELVGIIDNWAYVRAQVDGEAKLGYMTLDALTDVDEYKVFIVSGSKADSKTILYNAANDRAKEIIALKNGTACFALFGRKEGNWVKVRVGGVTGWIKYTQAANLVALGNTARSAVPYYPLVMQTKTDALLYSVKGDKTERYMTLGQDMKVEVLAESDTYVYVRTLEGGAGTYDRGDFGYMALSDLTLAQSGTSVGVAQMDDGDLPVVILDSPDADGKMIGALCSGAQVRIAEFTQTDYIKISLNGLEGYVAKKAIRMLTGAPDETSGRIPQRALLTESCALRDTPKEDAQSGESVEKDSRVYMLGICGDWAFVMAGDGPNLDVSGDTPDRTGFIPLDKLNAPASTTHLTAFVTKDKVNLRGEASSVTGEIIGKARLGERLRVADYGTEWTCVVTPDGKRGYVMTEYLEFE